MSKQLSRITLILSLAILLTAICAGPVMGQQRRSSASAYSQQSAGPSKQVSNESAAAVFRAARDLITDGEWARAQDKFSEYVNKFPNEKNLDAALYWLAHSQYKLSKYDQCRQTVNKLFTKYQNSTWLDDARLLLAQIPGAIVTTPAALPPAEAAAVDELIAAAKAAAPPAMPKSDLGVIYAPGAAVGIGATPLPAQIAGSANLLYWDSLAGAENDDDPCEFKIVVLQALFQTDIQRGIVAATDWVKPGSTQTARCKSAALTLLSRHGGKAATPVILGMAKNEPDVKLRARAISTLGVTSDDAVIEPLRDFVLNSNENEIVEASLYALSRHTNDRVIGVLTEIATRGKTPAQRKAAIMGISTRAGDPAVDALFQIYDADQSVEIRKAVINGFANRKSERAGQKLFDIARTSDNLELRKAAIYNISRRGGDKAIDFLIALYDTEKNEELKEEILNGFASGNSFPLIPPKLMGEDGGYRVAAQNAFNTRNEATDKRIIRKLIDIAKNQQESMVRRKRAIGWLSRSTDPDVQRFLEELLKQ